MGLKFLVIFQHSIQAASQHPPKRWCTTIPDQ